VLNKTTSTWMCLALTRCGESINTLGDHDDLVRLCTERTSPAVMRVKVNQVAMVSNSILRCASIRECNSESSLIGSL
jgi:hypothetical protein